MFKTIFDTLHIALDDIVLSYPVADDAEQLDLQQKLIILKQYSDECIELWMSFEERINELQTYICHAKASQMKPPLQITIEQNSEKDEISIVISQLVFPFSKFVWYANNNKSEFEH